MSATCLCRRNPETGLRLDIVCPVHDPPCVPPGGVDLRGLPPTAFDCRCRACGAAFVCDYPSHLCDVCLTSDAGMRAVQAKRERGE